MSKEGPLQLVENLMNAINNGDIDKAIALYEPEAVMVAEPGKVMKGKDQILEALKGFNALKPTLKTNKHEIIEVGDIALFCSDWVLLGTGPDGSTVEMAGKSADILRRQPDGSWLIAVDNPWGTAILS